MTEKMEMHLDTPLALYNQAYNLQYEKGKTKDACKLYREIIRKFPESNECAYSVIQLEKIGAKEVLGTLKTNKFFNTLSIVNFILNIISICSIGVIFYLLFILKM